MPFTFSSHFDAFSHLRGWQGLKTLIDTSWDRVNFELTLRRGNGVDIVVRKHYDPPKWERQFTIEDRIYNEGA